MRYRPNQNGQQALIMFKDMRLWVKVGVHNAASIFNPCD